MTSKSIQLESPWQITPLPTFTPFSQPAVSLRRIHSDVKIADPPSPWRLTYIAGKLIASVDVPGVRLEDLAVEFSDGELKVCGRRFDNHMWVVLSQLIGMNIDVTSADAVLDEGILTVTMKLISDTRTHKVAVRKK